MNPDRILHKASSPNVENTVLEVGQGNGTPLHLCNAQHCGGRSLAKKISKYAGIR